MTEAKKRPDSDDISRRLKAQAERQRIRIELTEEQLATLRDVWNEGDPKAPAQVTFFVEGRDIAEMAVAGYRYRGDTCCA